MKKELKGAAAVLLLGMVYFIWLFLTGMGIPCLFKKITGWSCPGCGITTLFLCLARWDLSGAYAANPFLFVTGPLLLAQYVYYTYLRLKGKKLPRWDQVCLTVYLTFLIVFGVCRNL